MDAGDPIQEEARTQPALLPMIGESAPIRELMRLIERVAPTEASVLITGDSGSGKELVAQLIHARSERGDDVERPADAGEAAQQAVIDRTRLEIRVGSRIDEVERSLIEATLAHFQGNKRRAAETLGCSLKTLYNKLNSYCRKQEYANS